MATTSKLLLLGLCSQQAVAASYMQRSQYCVAACSAALQRISFGEQKPAVAAPAVPCTITLYIDSLFACATMYCSEKEAESGLAYSNATCLATAGRGLPSYTAFMANRSMPDTRRISHRQAMTRTHEPVIPDGDLYNLGYRSMASMNRTKYLNWVFAWALYGFWALVIVVGMITRGVQCSARHSRQLPLGLIRGEVLGRQHGSIIARAGRAVRRNLLMPLVFGNDRQTPLEWCAPPTRIEGLLLGLYVVMNIVFCFPGYTIVQGNLYSPEQREQLGQYVCNRAGSLALANIPIIWVFAARNDPLLWLTGWSYATYSQFHRWSARIATLLAIVHGAGFSIIDGWQGRYVTAWEHRFWYMGAISVVSMSVLVISSIYMVRKRWYDVFLVVHIAFAVLLLVALWFHLEIHSGAYNGFIWPAVAIWSLDRLLRIARVAWLSFTPSVKGIQATASSCDENRDLIRLDVTDFFKGQKTTPGMFYFVYEPGRVRGYESHPFTLCTWNYYSHARSTGSSETSSLDEKRKHSNGACDREAELKDVEPGLERVHTAENEARHTFLIRPREGFTQRLRNHQSRDFRILLEGPYGVGLHMHQYASVVMIIGGSGITAAISRAYSLLRSGSPRTVRLVWAAKRRDMVDDVCRHELSGVLGKKSRFQLDVYITSNSKAEKDDHDVSYTLHAGRPHVHGILDEGRAECAGSMAVFCCGPPGLEASVRSSVTRLLGEEGPPVAFLEERFSW